MAALALLWRPQITSLRVYLAIFAGFHVVAACELAGPDQPVPKKGFFGVRGFPTGDRWITLCGDVRRNGRGFWSHCATASRLRVHDVLRARL